MLRTLNFLHCYGQASQQINLGTYSAKCMHVNFITTRKKIISCGFFSVNCWFHFSFLFGPKSEKNAIDCWTCHYSNATQQMLDVAYWARLSNEFLSRFSSLLSSFLRRGGFISSEAEQGKFACEVISAFDSNHHCPLTLCAHMRNLWIEMNST